MNHQVMRENDLCFYRRRALQEQIAAQRASSDAARRSHEKLATAYRFRAAMASEPVSRWTRALDEGFATELA
jgi:uncharacterized protein YigA (DUF484 family)